jgi:hypothetical protein
MRHGGSSYTKAHRDDRMPREQYSIPRDTLPYNPPGYSQRQAFHHPRTSLGATGHWIHMATVAAPLIIPELTKDPEKRWRYLRLTSVGAAIASEIAWTAKLSQERKKDEACVAASHEAER